jgi:two-component system, NarL family, sensor histidine kinase UhpB
MRFSRLPLLWRVFVINAALLAAATLLLALTPVTIHASIALVEVADLVVALGLMLALNFLLLKPVFAPLDRLVGRMATVDLLRPGQRLAESGGVEVATLVRSFNQMLGRLEAERRESGRRALAAQEAERLRIARGLHDEVGQVLTGVLLQLDALAAPASDQVRSELDETKATVRRALEEVRRIARELRPEMLEQLGLVSALTALATSFADVSGIAVERRFDDELPQLSDEAELAVYRVAQEGLTNIARHSGARKVELALAGGPSSVTLRLVDDGRGLGGIQPPDGGGLRGMRERALLVGGALAIKTGRRGGLEVRLEVPAGTAV